MAAAGLRRFGREYVRRRRRMKEKREKIKGIYKFSKFCLVKDHFALAFQSNSSYVLYLAATQFLLWVPHLAENCLVLRAISPGLWFSGLSGLRGPVFQT